MLTIEYIQKHTKATILNTEANLKGAFDIEHIDFDTRRLKANSVYITLTIGQTDGHLYIQDALEKGAVAILVSNEQAVKKAWLQQAVFLLVEDTVQAFQALAHAYRMDLNVPVIGITGSNGKTTSKDIIASLLSTKLSVHKTHKNFNNHLGVPLTLLQANESHDVIVLEMGMNHAGELDVLGSISKPNYVVITNIGESHIEHLGSRENIAHAKGELLGHLQEGGIAFLPYDSEFCELLTNKTNEMKAFFNIRKGEDAPKHHDLHPSEMSRVIGQERIFAHELDVRNGNTHFTYGFRFGDIQDGFSMPLFGEHNVLNTIPAVALAKEFGFTGEEIQAGLQNIVVSPMRFERMLGKNNTTIINDAYNASPTSMQKSSQTFLDIFTTKRRVLVLGDMYELGDESLQWHKNVGETLNEQIDKVEFLVTVGDDARAISGAFMGRKRHFENKDDATKFLEVFLDDTFVLFFKASRGMKLETIVNHLI